MLLIPNYVPKLSNKDYDIHISIFYRTIASGMKLLY